MAGCNNLNKIIRNIFQSGRMKQLEKVILKNLSFNVKIDAFIKIEKNRKHQ